MSEPLKCYSFKDVAGQLGSPITVNAMDGEPIMIDFMYRDKAGVLWRVHAQGQRHKVHASTQQHFPEGSDANSQS